MKLISNITALAFAFIVSGCELIEIGSQKRSAQIDYTQNTPLGAIYLFKAEMDNNNSIGAVQMLRQDSGEQYLAAERIEMIDEVDRLRRVINSERITFIEKDSLNPDKLVYTLEFAYYKKISFTAKRIKNLWYIVAIKES